MKTNLKLLLALAATALCASTLASAQEDPMAKGQQEQSASQSATAAPEPSMATQTKSVAQTKFDALDVNHDGYIDKQEAAASKPLLNEFAKIDTNKDSKLSLIEFQNVKDLAAIKVKTTGDAYR